MIDQFGVVGLSWRQGSETLARFTLPVEERETHVAELLGRVGAAELVYLATCNRVEVAFVADSSTRVSEYRPRIFAALSGREARPGEAERLLRAWGGEGAVEHLFMVAAGLDSAQVGEREIRGQVRDAVRAARKSGACGPLLGDTFDEALKVARRVHELTGIGDGKTSLAEIALQRVRERVASRPGTVALVGVSPMTRTCAQALKAEGVPLLVVNRTEARAAELAREMGGAACSLAEFQKQPQPVVATVLATAAREPVLDATALAALASVADPPPLLVDMAIPPDVDGEAARGRGFELVTMDQISAEAESNRERRRQEVAAAREEIDAALVELRRRLAERWVAPVLARLSQRYRETALDGVERIKRELPELDDTQQAALVRWAESLARRFAHIPARGLRALAAEAGSEAVERFLAASDDSLAQELKSATSGLAELPPVETGES